MDSILKFILYARKHPDKQLHYRFKASHALGKNRDFDWVYEDRKSNVVQQLCTVDMSKKSVIKAWKFYKRKLCYYPEFFGWARYLFKDAKRKDYKPSILDLLD